MVKVNNNFWRYSAISSNVKGPIKFTGKQAMEFSDKVLTKNNVRKIKTFQGLIFLNTLKLILEFLKLKWGNIRGIVCVIVNIKDLTWLIYCLTTSWKSFDMKTFINSLEVANVDIVGQDLTEKTEKGDKRWTGAKLHTTCDNKCYRKKANLVE